MRTLTACTVLVAILIATQTVSWSADAASLSASGPQSRAHDFDFELGEWRTVLKLLKRPLTGSKEWLDYVGTTRVTGLLNKRANIVELEVSGSAGRIDGASLRVYDPAAREWTLNFFNIVQGQLTPPVTGHFEGSRGEFYGDDTLNDKPIKVRFIITKVSADVCRFEQAFSGDSGRTWEVNWIATDTRVAQGGAARAPGP